MSGFHAGERAMQARAGVAERMAPVAPRALRDFMPDQHRELFEKLPFMLLGGLDAQRRPWATLLAGPPGFVQTPDARTLRLAADLPDWDPLAGTLAAGAQVGLLGIELATRRRNRANGVVASRRPGELVVDVRQSFGNCPKYINQREPRWSPVAAPPRIERFGQALPAQAAAQVAAADTFFIATAAPVGVDHGGVDVSHRGGPPGFVRLDGAGTLTVPDYLGNFFFNTFGNLALNPRAGLLFVDVEHGDVLLLTGRAEVLWDAAELASFEGAQRLLRFELEAGLHARAALPLRTSA
jgi:predicted pyridoxine 5'-phosphate oxidase superfamily flavin-nucleotide-binding protein